MLVHTLEKTFHIAVDGNMGAGKSTFLKKVGEILPTHLHAQVVFEPHQEWQNIGGANLLDLFYKDPKRWAYTFQSHVLSSRIKQFQKMPYAPVQVVERSIYSNYYCFGRNCFEQGLLTPLEWHLYEEFFNQFAWQIATPDAFIYLRVDPEVCYQRIAHRQRTEEGTVSLAYVRQLHEKYEDLLINKKDVPEVIAQKPVLVIDGNQEFEGNPELCAHYAHKIEEFIMLYNKKS